MSELAGLTYSVVDSYCLSRLRETFYTSPAYLDLDEDCYKRCVMVPPSSIMVRPPANLAVQIADLGGSTTAAAKIERKVKEISDLEGVPYVFKIFDVEDPPARAERMRQRNELVLTLEKVITDWLEACREAEKMGQPQPYPGPMMRP